MGACRAPISHLLNSPPSTVPTKSSNLADPIHHKACTNASGELRQVGRVRRRHLLLFSTSILPISLTVQSNSWCSALESLDLVSAAEREASATISQRVAQGVELLEKGRELQAQGDFNQALEYFTQVISNYKDLAFSEYARVGRALALYEVGDRDEAITEMEDVSISLKGYPEVHAALAAALYADKHAPLLAENQFAIATLLDPHYTDLSYVREKKHWPPSLVSSLQNFITLS